MNPSNHANSDGDKHLPHKDNCNSSTEKKLRFLIADDHVIVRRGLKRILIEEFPAAFIEEAKDADMAIEKSEAGNWDLIICDLAMPGKSGLHVLKTVKEKFPDMRVLILTVHPSEQYEQKSIQYGASGYLNKDIHPEQLISAIRRAMNPGANV